MMGEKQEVTIEVYRSAHDGETDFISRIPDLVLHHYTQAVLEGVLLDIQKRIVDEWFARYAGELFEQLAPGVIADQIKQKLHGAIAKRVLGEDISAEAKRR